MKKNNYLLTLLLTLISCGTKEIRVIKEKYSNGNAKTMYYFNNANDAKQNVTDTNIGKLIAVNKALNLREEQFFEDGKQATIGKYENGRAQGLWVFYNENGAVKSRAYYNKGYSVDTVNCYSETGRLNRLVIEIDKTKKYWHSIDYYDDGSKMIECYKYTDTLGNSFFDGPYKEWHINGQLKQEAVLKMGSSIGKWTAWDDNGNVIKASQEPFIVGIE